MLWYKDKRKFNWQKLFEGVAIGLAIAVIGFTTGYFYETARIAVVRHCVW